MTFTQEDAMKIAGAFAVLMYGALIGASLGTLNAVVAMSFDFNECLARNGCWPSSNFTDFSPTLWIHCSNQDNSTNIFNKCTNESEQIGQQLLHSDAAYGALAGTCVTLAAIGIFAVSKCISNRIERAREERRQPANQEGMSGCDTHDVHEETPLLSPAHRV